MPEPRTNILIIHTDQHRWDCLGAAGNLDVRTPHLDSLAAIGTLYRNHFCTYPVCTPSRYSLLSGLNVRQHGGWTNHCTLASHIATFPKLLRAAGWRTAAIGKMHFTPTYLDAGFDRMTLVEQDGPGRFEDDYHAELQRRGLADRIDIMDQRAEYRAKAPPEYWENFGAAESDLPEEMHSTTWIGNHAVTELENWDSDADNLLMAGFVKPHHPFDPPKPWSRMYDPASLNILPGWLPQPLAEDLTVSSGYLPHAKLNETALRRVMAMYYACISQIDHHVGRMLEVLHRRGLFDRTMIIFTSDHGDYLGFHHLLLKGNRPYDPILRIPLIIKYPNNRTPIVSNALCSNTDIAPTILALAGLKPALGMTGLDLATKPNGHQAIFAEDSQGEECIVRTTTRKLILNAVPDRNAFFDMEADPYELHNLYSDPACKDEVHVHEKLIHDWATFKAITPTVLDHDTLVIRSDRNRVSAAKARSEMEAYFREKLVEIPSGLFRLPL